MESSWNDNKRVFQTAAWMWVIYVGLQLIIDLVIYKGMFGTPVQTYYWVSFIPAFIFLILTMTKILKNGSRPIVAVLILVISMVPVVMIPLFDLKMPQAPLSNVEGMIIRQLPVLLIALVLAAWHFNILFLVGYVLGVGSLEILVSSSSYQLNDPRLLVFLFTILIRTVCFMVVGIFINQLISRLRMQQQSLKAANERITHYASTLENLTISRERNRMSRELHDTVVHTLSGLAVQLETTKAYLDVDPLTAKSLLDQSLEATRSGLQETRRAIKALRAAPIDDLGMVNALRQLAEITAQRANLKVDLHFPDENLILTPDVEQCVFRITQEAVENVVHHANAKNLFVQLSIKGKDIDLMIKDDGIGFHPQANLSPAGHFGLSGMKERAQIAGGTLTITSKPDQGTAIHLSLIGCVS